MGLCIVTLSVLFFALSLIDAYKYKIILKDSVRYVLRIGIA